ncbi:MAG: CPBP family intramembrane glutamic endopeptidase [Myxococcota bacterium]|nr:CPBP family intramembrane glutamic endopeptidase [Myxococcota bacterium]MEC9443029.1 CPBP family intramembrane glutamic endopeptidase [Myxococcota bacterium]
MSKKKSSNVAVVETTGGLRDYLRDSKDLRTGLVLVVPLFILYQIGVLATDGIRNGVDFVTTAMWWVAQGQTMYYLGLNLLILLAFAGGIYFLRDQGKLRPKIWPIMLAESTLYALFFGAAVVKLMSVFGLDATLASGAAQEMNLIQKLVLSMGAGLYEETVFRLIGMGGLYYGMRKFASDVPGWVAAIIAVLVSSLIFSAIHHVGSMGEVFTLGAFLFRFFAGILLAVIFHVRGFAVAVYTHAIYDIFVMVF